MKQILFFFIVSAITAQAGWLDKNKDGKYAALTNLSEKASAVAATASNEWEKASDKSKETYAKTVEDTKKAMTNLSVKAEDIKADLGKSTEEMKAKVNDYKEDKLLAYAEKCKTLYSSTQTKVVDYTEQVKNLKWSEKFSSKGKELKGQLSQYKDELKGLESQYSVYTEKLKAMGINLSDYGLGSDVKE